MCRLNLQKQFVSAVYRCQDAIIPFKKKFGKRSKLVDLCNLHVVDYHNYHSLAHSALFDVWSMIQLIWSLEIDMSESESRTVYALAPKHHKGDILKKPGKNKCTEILLGKILLRYKRY